MIIVALIIISKVEFWPFLVFELFPFLPKLLRHFWLSWAVIETLSFLNSSRFRNISWSANLPCSSSKSIEESRALIVSLNYLNSNPKPLRILITISSSLRGGPTMASSSTIVLITVIYSTTNLFYLVIWLSVSQSPKILVLDLLAYVACRRGQVSWANVVDATRGAMVESTHAMIASMQKQTILAFLKFVLNLDWVWNYQIFF